MLQQNTCVGISDVFTGREVCEQVHLKGSAQHMHCTHALQSPHSETARDKGLIWIAWPAPPVSPSPSTTAESSMCVSVCHTHTIICMCVCLRVQPRPCTGFPDVYIATGSNGGISITVVFDPLGNPGPLPLLRLTDIRCAESPPITLKP